MENYIETENAPSLSFVAVYAVVHVAVRDVGGFYSLHIYDLDSGEEYGPNKLGNTHYDLEHKFSASLLQQGVGSITIRVYAEDYAGNSIQVEKTLKGAFQTVLDALAKLWNAIWSTLQRVAQAVARAVSVIVEWVMQMVNNTLAKLLSPLINAYNSWQTALILTVKEGWKEYNKTGFVSHGTMDSFNNLLGGTLFYILMGIAVGLIALSLTLNGLTLGTMSIITTVVAPLVTLAIMQVFSVTQEKKASVDLSSVRLGVDTIWNFVVSLVSGKGTRAMVRAENSLENAVEYAALIFKGSAVVRESIEITLSDIVGFKSKAMAFILGTLGLALAVIGAVTNLKPLSIVAIGIGIVGLGISFYNLIHHKISGTEKLVKLLTLILGAIGIGLAITSLTV